jgi:hypothetical protein
VFISSNWLRKIKNWLKPKRYSDLFLRTVYQNNPTMNLKVEQAIAMARNNESLEGLVIEDLKDTQVRAVDALALAEHGVLLPEQNIYYDDDDIAYDPDFDEVEWSKEPLKMTWEEKMELAAQIEKNAGSDEEISAPKPIKSPNNFPD